VVLSIASLVGRIQPFQYVRDPCPANTKVAGKSRPVFELSGVEQRLVIVGPFERIARFLRSRGNLRFWFAGTVPGDDIDDSRSM
jgi:hypothetical protein